MARLWEHVTFTTTPSDLQTARPSSSQYRGSLGGVPDWVGRSSREATAFGLQRK
jgi:hypothetical protein